MAFTSPIWFDGQAVSVAHAVWAYCEAAVRLRDARAAGEVVALVDGDHEQRVALVDAVRGEVLEERLEGVVVVLQLRLVGGLARARSPCSRSESVAGFGACASCTSEM